MKQIIKKKKKVQQLDFESIYPWKGWNQVYPESRFLFLKSAASVSKMGPGVTLFHGASLWEQGGRHHMLHSIWKSLPGRARFIHHLRNSPADDRGVSFIYAKCNMGSCTTRADIKG